ncbi:hypothetical protein JCM8547_008197 [Rhodosporidiobolus lusitaniae]
MSDSEEHVELTALSSKDKPQNEACTNCRAVKRRCHNEGRNTRCQRCTKQDLECTYFQQKRGRKAGAASSAMARPRKRRATEGPEDEAPSAGGKGKEKEAVEPAQAPASALPAGSAGPGGDWLQSMLLSQETSSSTAPHLVPLQPAAYPVQFPAASSFYHHPNIPLSGMPNLPPPSSISFSPASAAAPFPSTSRLPPVAPQPPTAPLLARPRPPIAPAYTTGLTTLAGPSPGSAFSPTSNANASSPGSATVQATPATGGFSLRKLMQENHGKEGENGDASPPRQSLADAFVPSEEDRMSKPERLYEDLVVAGILPEEQVQPLFEFYFLHLNPMTSLLDPLLHTVDFCRSRSAILFTAILTVASKVALPALYPPSLKWAKALLGQAFEAGTNNLELIQAVATLVFWQDATEEAGARKLAYAIRSAFELGIHKKGKRPLPEDEMERRRVLNTERTWFYLTIADHRFSTQRGLPKMISNEYRRDAVPWTLEHDGPNFCPHETGLIPLIELGRILDVFGVLISPGEDNPPSMDLLKCLERDIESWRDNWSSERSSMPLQPAQASLVRFYAQVLQFQILELNLFIAIKRTAELDTVESFAFDPRSSPTLVFRNCVLAAIRVLDTMERELRFMVYSFDSMWVGAASSAIWIAQNLSGMEPRDRTLSLAAISRLESACTQHSTSHQSMAGYTARLLEHLQKKAKTAEAAATAKEQQQQQQQQQRGEGPPSDEQPQAAMLHNDGVPASALQHHQPHVTASLSAPTWSHSFSGTTAGAAQSNGTPAYSGGGGTGGGTAATNGVGVFGGAVENFASANAGGGVDQPTPWLTGGLGGEYDFLGAMQAPLQSFGADLPFPAADDALWSSLFPLFSTE